MLFFTQKQKMYTNSGTRIIKKAWLTKIAAHLVQHEVGLAVTDIDFTILWLSNQWGYATGLKLEEVKGRKLNEVIGGLNKSERSKNNIWKSRGPNGSPNSLETLLHSKSGEPRSFPVHIKHIEIDRKKLMLFYLLPDGSRLAQKLYQAKLSAQESLKEQIGKELHDNVNQLLSSVKLYQGLAVDNADVRVDLIRKANLILIDAMQEIRNLSHALVGISVKEKGLKVAIEDTLERIRQTNRFQIRFNYEVVSEALSPKVKLGVFRIVQEQLSNILKHSNAKQIFVCIKTHEKKLFVTVADDGVGFEFKKTNGIGFSNIEARVKLLKARYAIESEPGKGCKLIIEMPLSIKESGIK